MCVPSVRGSTRSWYRAEKFFYDCDSLEDVFIVVFKIYDHVKEVNRKGLHSKLNPYVSFATSL